MIGIMIVVLVVLIGAVVILPLFFFMYQGLMVVLIAKDAAKHNRQVKAAQARKVGPIGR